MPRKPDNLIYGVDDRPPLPALVVLGFQHICVMTIAFIMPAVVIDAVGGTESQEEALICMAMFATGIGTVLQGLNRGPVGSGYLCPLLNGPAFLAASTAAARAGGLALLFGMTAIGGLFEMVFARVVARLRAFFPAEVTGTIVMLVAVEVVPVSVMRFMGVDHLHPNPSLRATAVAAITLLAMIGFSVWGKGKLRLYAVLLGMLVGYAAAACAGLLDYEFFVNEKYLRLPPFGSFGLAFDPALLLPFLIAALASSLKTMGDVTTCQKINDADWRRPEMGSISRGIMACGVSNVLSGLCGAMGQSVSSANIGMGIATGATSRTIAHAAGGILILMAFVPKLAAVFVIMPTPVMGASLLFAVSFMIVAGISIICTRMIDARKTFIVGIALIAGMSVEMKPELFTHFPPVLAPLARSSLALGAMVALGLNMIFRIGVARAATLTLIPGVDGSEQIFAFMERQGAAWGALRDVIGRAKMAVNELFEMIEDHELSRELVTVKVRFDEFNLDIDVGYAGKACALPTDHPAMEHILVKEEKLDISAFLVHHFTDRIAIDREGEANRIRLHWDH